MTAHVVELEIPPCHEHLAVARRFVAAAAGVVTELGPERLDDLQVAVSEACTNAINAHEARGSADPIELRCAVSEHRVEVTISDHGGGFDPADTVQAPHPDDPCRLQFEQGLGLQIMGALADRLELRRSELGMAVHVVMLPDTRGRGEATP